MVATFSKPDSARTLFPYLKSCKPAPGIAAQVPEARRDPFDYSLPKSSSGQRLLSLLLGSAQAAAISLGLWVSALPQALPVVEVVRAKAIAPQAQDQLWHTLGSKNLAQVLLAAKEKQTQAALAAAEQAKLQAQQVRLDAEARAQNLTSQAAEQARKKIIEAVRQADLIALDATYNGAEQVIYATAGDDITLKFAARIQCKDGSFGETAVAAPVDSRITPREVRNLAVCYPSIQTPAGEAIGQAGDWGVAFFKLE